ncbi:MAG: hypothetical protein KC457_26965 [Myxococcales bacterium]|nr:hypothetical protein [Myxococcales bacterium]
MQDIYNIAIGFVVAVVLIGLTFLFMLKRRGAKESLDPKVAAWPQVSAVIIASYQTGSTSNGKPLYDFLVLVSPPGQVAYEAKTWRYLEGLVAARYYKEGVRVLVRVSPKDPQRVEDITLADPPLPRPPL